MCQCSTDPFEFTANNTFFVLDDDVNGRNRIAVHGIPKPKLWWGCVKVYERVPFSVLNTRIAPSPHPAARNLPSGENLVQNTSEGQSLQRFNRVSDVSNNKNYLIVIKGAKRFTLVSNILYLVCNTEKLLVSLPDINLFETFAVYFNQVK